MTQHTGKIHRLSNLIIEPDRRVKNLAIKEFHFKKIERRITPHEYSGKKVFICAPVEPEPYKSHEKDRWNWNDYLYNFKNMDEFKIRLIKYCPFSPEDKIVALEEWIIIEDFEGVTPCEHIYNKRYCDENNMYQDEIFLEASTMPIELDCVCKRYKVEKVLGVEEVLGCTGGRQEWDKKWYFKLLCDEDYKDET